MATKDRKIYWFTKFFHKFLFGDHQLHHLFPTIDADYLEEIYPVFFETVEEFGLGKLVERYGWLDMLTGLYSTLQKFDESKNRN